MKSLLSKIILIGIFLGLLSSVFVMFLGLIVYYALKAADVMMLSFFLEKVAIASIVTGVICCFSWYIYLLLIAKRYFFKIVSKATQKDKK